MIIEALTGLKDTRPSFDPSSCRTRLWCPNSLIVNISGYEDGDSDNYRLRDSFVAGFGIVASSCPYVSNSKVT